MLIQFKTIAVVGLSSNPERESHGIAIYLREHGYRIIPVNPMAEEILGEKSYPSLRGAPEPVDVSRLTQRGSIQLPAHNSCSDSKCRVAWAIHREKQAKRFGDQRKVDEEGLIGLQINPHIGITVPVHQIVQWSGDREHGEPAAKDAVEAIHVGGAADIKAYLGELDPSVGVDIEPVLEVFANGRILT